MECSEGRLEANGQEMSENGWNEELKQMAHAGGNHKSHNDTDLNSKTETRQVLC
jgi:hypothetical protein